jgi:hypothetical protein
VAVAGVVAGVTGVSVPHALPVQLALLRLQVTAVFVEPVTVAVMTTDCVGYMALGFTPEGVLIATAMGMGISPLPPFAHPTINIRPNRASPRQEFFMMTKPPVKIEYKMFSTMNAMR